MTDSTVAMTLTDFLRARLADDEAVARERAADAMTGWRWKHYPKDAYDEVQALTLAHSRRMLAECEAKRRIVELHESWPVMTETPPKLDLAGGDLNNMTLRMSQQIAWLTTKEYRARFGDEPPTTPILAALALPYADHPDFREEWRS